LRDGAWWKAPLASTLIGSTVDTIVFFSIAFSGAFSFVHPATDVSWAAEVLPVLGAGPLAPLWVSLAVADWAVKLSLALLALVPFRVITARLRAA
ncbi:MAG: VUT family protein, partial [Sulfitobacter sp.]